MTVIIKLNPLVERNASIIVGDHGMPENGSLFFPNESAHAVSGTYGFTQGQGSQPPLDIPTRLVITHLPKTYDNEASWNTSVKEQLAALVVKEKIIVAQTAAAKGPGTGDSIAESGIYAKLTDAGASFDAGDVGRTIILSGAPTVANDGTFTVLEVVDANNLIYNNTNRVAEAAPALTWNISGPAGLDAGSIRAL